MIVYTKISAGNGYIIECLEDGYKILRCPDDEPNKRCNGISADKSITLGCFKKLCKEWIQERQNNFNAK
jgi:hypothetical protein